MMDAECEKMGSTCTDDRHRATLYSQPAVAPLRELVNGSGGGERKHRRFGCCLPQDTTVFGEVVVTRRGDSCSGYEGLFPLDTALNLPRGKYSHDLREMLTSENTQWPFAKGACDVGDDAAKKWVEERTLEILRGKRGNQNLFSIPDWRL